MSKIPQEKKVEKSEDNEKMMNDEPLRFENIDVSDISELPINEDNIKSLILKGNVESYPVWIPIWNREKQRVEKREFHIKPISQGDWDYCVATQTNELGFEALVLAKCLVDEYGDPYNKEIVKKLPIGVRDPLFKEIRKISGYFPAPRV